MYPRFSDMLNDWFGTSMELPAKTFGFFLALAFAAAFIALRSELRRRELAGHFRWRDEKVRVSGPVPWHDLLFHLVVWGLAGYKLGYMFVNYQEFVDDTQGVIMSSKGWIPGALIGALAGGAPKLMEWYKNREAKEVFRTLKIGPSWHLSTYVTIAFIAGILGSKLFAHMENPAAFLQNPVGSLLSLDGLSFFGGLLCAGFLISRFIYRRGWHLLTAMDCFAPAMILAYAVGRIGCQMSGDGDWGIANPHPNPGLPAWLWAYDYPHNVAQAGTLRIDCLGEFCTKLDAPVWPTPLYETIMGLAIFGILWLLRTRVKYPGQITALYFILIGMERFWIEKIRVNDLYTVMGIQFTQAEAIATGMMVAGLIIGILVMRRKRPFDSFEVPPAAERGG